MICRFFLLTFSLLFLGIAAAGGQVVLPPVPETLSLHGHIASATAESLPVMTAGYLVFPYRGNQKPYRFVGIAFDYEGYSRIHAFVKNKKGTFVYYGKVPEGIKEFRYRLVVDSVWQHDTSNPIIEYDQLGVRLSKFVLPETGGALLDKKAGPQFRADGTVDFYLKGEPNVYAFIMGSFNQWDPFMTPMKEISPGLYKVSLTLKPGRYYYNFLFNGKRMRDPNNFFQAMGPGGELVSVFDIVPKADESASLVENKEKTAKNKKSSSNR